MDQVKKVHIIIAGITASPIQARFKLNVEPRKVFLIINRTSRLDIPMRIFSIFLLTDRKNKQTGTAYMNESMLSAWKGNMEMRLNDGNQGVTDASCAAATVIQRSQTVRMVSFHKSFELTISSSLVNKK